MPRKARVKEDFGTFYVYQKSAGIRSLFECNRDRKQFLNILARTQTKYQFKCFAFCILENDEYHLVLDVNGGDLSKIMKSINISYAMYAKCKGKLFKDRFKSQLLINNTEIKQIINTIHKRNTGNSLWNSYCTFNGLMPLDMTIHSFDDEQIPHHMCMHTISEAKDKLTEIAVLENLSLQSILNNKTKRNQLIKDFRKHSTLTLKELGEIFGGLSESSICKILNL